MTDGNIVAARTRLEHAVDRLIKPRLGTHHNHTVTALSLYGQLVSDLAGTQGDTRTPAKSLPPLWIDACQLRSDIDTQTHKWVPKPGSTPQRLQSLQVKSWRPQDTDLVTGMARTVDGWCESITNLLDPQSCKFISAACPSCGRETIYRKDSGGEVVRQPALKLEINVGCQCQHCKAFWAPDRYLFLCRLLGFELPEGVLE